MGFIDKSTQTVTAVFTRVGRDVFSRAMTGDSIEYIPQNEEEVIPEYVITQFGLFDDEIDYSLWDESQDPNLKGRIIENQPLLEPITSEMSNDPGGGMYNYFTTANDFFGYPKVVTPPCILLLPFLHFVQKRNTSPTIYNCYLHIYTNYIGV